MVIFGAFSLGDGVWKPNDVDILNPATMFRQLSRDITVCGNIDCYCRTTTYKSYVRGSVRSTGQGS